MRILPIMLAAAVLGAASPAAAEFRQYKAKDVVTVEPSLAYFVVRNDFPTGLRLFRMVDDADRKQWEARRQEAFATARNKYERSLKTYERALKAYESELRARSERDSNLPMTRVKPKKPVEVTLENTPISPVEMGNFESIIRGHEIARGADGVRTFLIAVSPGTYVLYGADALTGVIGSGVCLCMGSVAFAAEAGRIIDVGTVRMSAQDLHARVEYVPPPPNPSVPTQLAGHQVTPAKVFAAGKMANHFGMPVTRAEPVPGILAYDRDIPLDVASGSKPVEAIR